MIIQAFDLSDAVIVQLGDVVGVMHGPLVIHCASNHNAIAVENDVVFEARCILQVLQDSVHLIDLIIGHDERERCVERGGKGSLWKKKSHCFKNSRKPPASSQKNESNECSIERTKKKSMTKNSFELANNR